ncbi:hypothetical protein D3C71_1639220 [compost metagenome]
MHCAARHDHHLAVIAHDTRERQPRLRCQAVQHRLHKARQPGRGEVAAREAQHLRRQPELAAIGLQVAQVGQRQQVPARCRPCDTGPLRCHRGIEALALGVKALQHGQALGQPGDEVFGCNGEGSLGHGGWREFWAIVAQIAR